MNFIKHYFYKQFFFDALEDGEFVVKLPDGEELRYEIKEVKN